MKYSTTPRYLTLLCLAAVVLVSTWAVVRGRETAPETEPMPVHARKPIPDPAALKALPPDGGPDFNRLVFESSPYLLQHAANPVNWYPWGKEAFAQARKENKPVFLSVGYSTCHWCHVMERESFEDEEVAALLNKYFIAVKVDREERPDIDKIYMDVTQSMTGRGGWPMTVIMTPEAKPFFAGTYFPKHSLPGRPGIMKITQEIGRAWEDERENIVTHADKITAILTEMQTPRPGEKELGNDTLKRAYDQLASRYDAKRGGFGKAPKFPTPHHLTFLLRYAQRSGDPHGAEMVEQTLTRMRRGGIWDHVGYGFHRYSTDADWLLPHFEKMLYDQALIALACLEAYQVTKNPLLAETAREIFAYVQRDMTSPGGGFYSAEDADSEGEEGKFYVWSTAEVRQILGEDADLFIDLYNLRNRGNFKHEAGGKHPNDNIPHLTQSLSAFAEDQGLKEADLHVRVEKARRKLFDVREQRVHPLKDDKILTDWNGLMIAAFALGGRVLDDASYTETARSAADFALANLRDGRGRLWKRYRNGVAGLPGLLDDYAFLGWGLIELYEATGEARYFKEALDLTDLMLAHFKDPNGEGLFLSPDDGETLLVRAKEIYDGALPSGNSVAAGNLLRLAHMTGRMEYADEARVILRAFASQVEQAPMGYTQLLGALDFSVGPASEVVVTGEAGSPGYAQMVRALGDRFLPRTVLLHKTGGPDDEILEELAPFTESMGPMDDAATAYVCHGFACEQPTTDTATMLRHLGGEGHK